MEKQYIFIEESYITLGQLLKLTNLFYSGGEIKHFLNEVGVNVNGEIETRRGRKLYDEDTVELEGKLYIVSQKNDK